MNCIELKTSGFSSIRFAERKPGKEVSSYTKEYKQQETKKRNKNIESYNIIFKQDKLLSHQE